MAELLDHDPTIEPDLAHLVSIPAVAPNVVFRLIIVSCILELCSVIEAWGKRLNDSVFPCITNGSFDCANC